MGEASTAKKIGIGRDGQGGFIEGEAGVRAPVVVFEEGGDDVAACREALAGLR